MTETLPDNNPVVSVIIPVYNGQRYLAETIESVIAQTVKNWEIIAINDGSTDNSLEILEKYTHEHPGHIRFVTVKNGGVSRARNTGAALARGRYFAFLDQDDLWAPEKLQRQIDLLVHNKDLGITFTNETVIDEKGSVICEKVLTFGIHQRGNVFEYLLFDNFIPVSSVIVKKELFTKVGGFDPRFSLAEDFDFLLKVAREAAVDYVDDPLLLYREHNESGTHTKIDRITAEAMEILRYWKKEYPLVFRRHFLQYQKFRLNFAVLKCKICLKKILKKIKTVDAY
ncbi:glycosyltransferase [Methanoregula sp.]|uniref:glycosyltransferase n=1 Tax=Methanoregula sp. TaxID=2052170 RepID=UPI003C716EE5